MSSIPLDFGVHTRNWLRIDLQTLKFNFELYFWRFRGLHFAKFRRSQKSRSQYQAKNPFKITKNPLKQLF